MVRAGAHGQEATSRGNLVAPGPKSSTSQPNGKPLIGASVGDCWCCRSNQLSSGGLGRILGDLNSWDPKSS